MRRSVHFRLSAFVIALLGSLSAPALALTHGLVHAHLASGHSGESTDRHHADEQHAAAPTSIEDHPADDHAHGHSMLAAVPGTRLLGRLDLTAIDPAVSSTPDVTVQALVAVHSPALADHALLARPDPGAGPPPRLRAPPIR